MPSVTIAGQDTPVRAGTIFCLGRNYLEHAKEMRAEVPDVPVVFLKPAAALTAGGGTVFIPSISNDCHHEVELVVLIGAGGSRIRRAQALDHVGGYGVGLDMTLRDVQAVAKAKGLPWTLSKGFATSAPVSQFVPAARIPDPSTLEIVLTVNGKERQRGHASAMIFGVDQIIEYLSSVFALEAGDLIFTGTPEGVARVAPGDRLQASLEGYVTLEVGVADA